MTYWLQLSLMALAATLTIFWLTQAIFAWRFVRLLKAWQVPLVDDAQAPEALVVLCLRGGDPFLEHCINGLLTQDYPNYRVRFMVDHTSDPALSVLHRALTKHNFDRYEIITLRDPLDTCSLKCSSLVQALTDPLHAAGQGGDYAGRFLALLDADVLPHRTWLRELATALRDPQVGAATGNRWYLPEQPTTGAVIRYLWNAAAVVPMYFYKIAWGGTLAIKFDSIARANLLEHWSLALCEDTMTQTKLSKIGQRLAFVPGLMMINREDCSVKSLLPWIRRQLLTTRLYHPYWSAVVAHGLFSAGLQVWGWGLALLCLLDGAWTLSAATLVTLLVFQVMLGVLLPWIEAWVVRIVQSREPATDDRLQSRIGWLHLLWMMFVTQWVYTWPLVSCMFIRFVTWRGIAYRTLGPWKIHMLGYRPYQSESESSLESL